MKIFYRIGFVLVFCFSGNSFCQFPGYAWVAHAGGSNWDRPYSMVTDAAGNIYMAGSFSDSSVTFGSITIFNNGSPSSFDLFIAKYNAGGNVIWAKSVGGSFDDFALGVTVDVSGNIYLTGGFRSSTILMGTNTLINYGFNTDDIFIAKCDSSGNFIWAERAGGSYYDDNPSITTDVFGNVYVACNTLSDSVYFGSIWYPGHAVILAKYDNNGNILNLISMLNNTVMSEPNTVASDANGNVILTGITGAATYSFGSFTFSNYGDRDIFIVKFDSSGSVLWANNAGGNDADYVHDFSVDVFGNYYITGGFSSDTMYLNSTSLINANQYDVFIAKYNNGGNLLWAKRYGGNDYDLAYAIKAGVSGNIYAGGHFNSDTIIFDTDTFTNAMVSTYPLFIVKLDSSGNEIWATSTGGLTSQDRVTCIASDNTENTYVAGYFYGTIQFGSFTLSSFNNSGDIFLAKLDAPTGIPNLHSSIFNFQLYPNPATDYITIQYNLTTLKEITVSLFNVYGQRVKDELAAGGVREIRIDMQSFPAGIYFVKVFADGKEEVRKVVKL